MHTIAICDTEPIAIEGIRSLAASSGGFRVVSADTCLADGAASVRDLLPSILLVNNAFGQRAVSDWIRELRASRSHTAILIWGTRIPESEALEYLRAGAAGVIGKTASLGALLRCFVAVASGAAWAEEGAIAAVWPAGGDSGSSPKRARRRNPKRQPLAPPDPGISGTVGSFGYAEALPVI
jgi:DNA-binding NarL/FixJ family response regulator